MVNGNHSDRDGRDAATIPQHPPNASALHDPTQSRPQAIRRHEVVRDIPIIPRPLSDQRP